MFNLAFFVTIGFLLTKVLFITAAFEPIRLAPLLLKQPTEAPDNDNGVVYLSKTEQTVKLPCEVEGSPKPVVTWFRDGKEFHMDEKTYRVWSDGLEITMTPEINRQRAEYYCLALNNFGTTVSTTAVVYFASIVQPDITTVEPLDVREGDHLRLPCKGPSSYPTATYDWVKNTDYFGKHGDLVPLILDGRVSVNPNTGDLYFAYLKLEDMQLDSPYQCRLYNPADTRFSLSSGVELKVQKVGVTSRPLELVDASGSPINGDVYNRNLAFIADGPYYLFCIFKGAPEFTYTWTKDGQSLDYKRYIIVRGGSQLRLKNPQHGIDDGVYNCKAEFKPGSSKSVAITVDVKEKPKITRENLPYTTIQSGTLKYKCDGTGNPTPTSKWLWNNGPLPSKWANMASDKEIVLTNLNRGGKCGNPPSTYDLGVLQCVLTNTFQKERKRVLSHVVNVVCPLVLKEPSPSGPAVQKTIKFGMNANFDLNWDSDPSRIPTFEWKMNGRVIDRVSTKGVLIYKDTGKLLFETIKYSDSEMDSITGVFDVSLTSKDPDQSQAGKFILAFNGKIVRLGLTHPTQGRVTTINAKWNETVDLPIAFVTDNDASEVKISWVYKGKSVLLNKTDEYSMAPNGTLTIFTKKLDSLGFKPDDVQGHYTVIIETENPSQRHEATYAVVFPNASSLHAAGSGLWWIAIVLAFIILLVIIVLIICMTKRNKGSDYYVDEKERKQGNDPEEECKKEGFKVYTRQTSKLTDGARVKSEIEGDQNIALSQNRDGSNYVV